MRWRSAGLYPSCTACGARRKAYSRPVTAFARRRRRRCSGRGRTGLGRQDGKLTADEARRRAARIVNRIKAGEDPIPEPLPARLAGGPTVAGLAARYMEKHVAVRCKQSTAEGIRGLLGKYILPEFGKLPLLAVERERVAAFHVRLNGVPYAANRAVALMSR